ncbi:MAG: protein-tyrosine phosphatase [Lentimonas sp.]|jgi:protein-tyrosine phosphatase
MDTTRHIPLESQPNFRDLGCYAAADGKRTRSGMLYRSGNLDQLTDADRDTIRALGIRTVADFRSISEAQADEAFWQQQGARYIHFPIDPGNLATLFWEAMRTGDSSALPDDILAVNNQLVIDEARSQYAELFKLLSEPSNLPLLFNCTHGKDRTGIAAVLILLAVGGASDDARSDYLLSNVYREAENHAQLHALRERVKDQPGIDFSKLEAAFTLQPHHYDVILESARKGYGSLENYFRVGLGCSDQQLSAIRENLLG